MIAVVVPVFNEERLLANCLEALRRAARHPGLGGEEVRLWVVLNGCVDRSELIARRAGVDVIVLPRPNVGRARKAGCEAAVAHGARWLAFTDADTTVAPDWLVAQLAAGTDVVCGTVAVDDWSAHGEHGSQLHRHFLDTYSDNDGHQHIHGANLGVATHAYLAAGGFGELACSEDVALVETLRDAGASISWSARPRVTTSARRDARARGGFGDTLLAVVSAMSVPAIGLMPDAAA